MQNEQLFKEFDAVNGEKSLLRTELDRKELELQNMQATCERYQARVAQLSKEYDELEAKLEVCCRTCVHKWEE